MAAWVLAAPIVLTTHIATGAIFFTLGALLGWWWARRHPYRADVTVRFAPSEPDGLELGHRRRPDVEPAERWPRARRRKAR